jgi:GR25 family glycosyltransferase involved in LPS biosynthesis
MLGDNKFATFVINLERRPDRKRYMEEQLERIGLSDVEFFKAVDGSTLTPNDRLKRLFHMNDFACRASIMGAALSHLTLWQRLVLDTENDFYVIMEDDISLHPNFKQILANSIDTLASSGLVYFGCTKFNRQEQPEFSTKESSIVPLDKSLYAGGFFCYSISKSAAKRACRYIFNHGI